MQFPPPDDDVIVKFDATNNDIEISSLKVTENVPLIEPKKSPYLEYEIQALTIRLKAIENALFRQKIKNYCLSIAIFVNCSIAIATIITVVLVSQWFLG